MKKETTIDNINDNKVNVNVNKWEIEIYMEDEVNPYG